MPDNPPHVFISPQRVYWDMLDLLGVLHNAAYIVMFERARFDFWSAHGQGPNDPEFDWPYVVARNSIDYRTAIRSEQTATVTVSVVRMGGSSVTFRHAVFAEAGTLSAEGETVLVRLDPVTQRQIPWSDRFRAMVAPYIQSV